jgi:hypothetical protein
MPDNTLRQPSHSARWSLIYITAGTLITIWGLVWCFFLVRNGASSPWESYICAGFLLSGIALIIIGVLVGRIGQEAKHADTPVGEVTAATVTSPPKPGAPTQTTAPATAPGQTPVVTTHPGGAVPAQTPVVVIQTPPQSPPTAPPTASPPAKSAK